MTRIVFVDGDDHGAVALVCCVIAIPAFVAAVSPAAPVKSTSPPGKKGIGDRVKDEIVGACVRDGDGGPAVSGDGPAAREGVGVHGHDAPGGVERSERESADGVVDTSSSNAVASSGELKYGSSLVGLKLGMNVAMKGACWALSTGFTWIVGRVGVEVAGRVSRVGDDDIQLVVNAGGDGAVLGHARRRRLGGRAASWPRWIRWTSRSGRCRRPRDWVPWEVPMVTFCPLLITSPLLMVSVAFETRR